jgi:hypothetical protein
MSLKPTCGLDATFAGGVQRVLFDVLYNSGESLD